jgi:Ca-activated chloride channel family protein
MVRKKVVFLIFSICSLVFLCLSFGFSDTVRISHIDNSAMLVNQKVRVYTAVTDKNGEPVKNLDSENFRLYESGKEKEILSFERGININQGINLLLVLDNSGSMYWDASGRVKNSSDESIWRITYAKQAIESFLNEMKNPLDKIGIVSFNVKMGAKVKPTHDKVAIVEALKEIKKPTEEEAYTELYETLYHSVDYLRTFQGRKIILLLSDGQNFPLEKNPNFPQRYGIDGAVSYAQQEGISVFTIGLSKRADRKNLRHIAEETGGAHFSVYDPAQLAGLYNLIRDQIINEYLLTYKAGMNPTEKRLVKVSYQISGMQAESERYYYSGTVFGFPQSELLFFIFLFIPAAGILLWVLSLIKFEKKESIPTLSVQAGGGRRKALQTISFTPQKTQVTIGGGKNTDITVAQDPRLPKTEAKIAKKGGVYSITSTGNPVTVNNRAVKTKVLRSGDMIQMGDTTVVFDEGMMTQDKSAKAKK